MPLNKSLLDFWHSSDSTATIEEVEIIIVLPAEPMYQMRLIGRVQSLTLVLRQSVEWGNITQDIRLVCVEIYLFTGLVQEAKIAHLHIPPQKWSSKCLICKFQTSINHLNRYIKKRMAMISSSFLGSEAVMLANASRWIITRTIIKLHRIPLMEDLPEDFLLVTTMPKACMQISNIIQPRYNYQASPSKYILTHPMLALELFLEQCTGCLHLQLVCAFPHSCPQSVLWPLPLLKLHQFPEVLITPKTKICLR